jgi:hypothetical protein
MKDRTSKTSRLSFAESSRFQRATYRIWLYCQVFGGEEALDQSIESDDDLMTEVYQKRKHFLDSFSSQELLELDATVGFLNSILEWTVQADGSFNGTDGGP